MKYVCLWVNLVCINCMVGREMYDHLHSTPHKGTDTYIINSNEKLLQSYHIDAR